MANVPNFIPQIWNAKIIRELENNLIAKKVANMSYSGEIRQKGDTVFFNSLSDPTVDDYAGTVSYGDLEDSQIAMVIDQAKYFAFNVDDIDAVQANVDLRGSQAQRAAYQLANTCDRYILGKYAEAANQITDTSCDTSTILSKIGEAGQKLSENNVPMQDRFLVIPPWVELKLKLAGVEFKINDGLKSGQGGLSWAEELGFKIYVSNNLTNTASTPVTECLAMSGNAIAFAEQLMKTEAVRRDAEFATGVRGLHVYGAKVIKPKEMVRLTLTHTAETAI